MHSSLSSLPLSLLTPLTVPTVTFLVSLSSRLILLKVLSDHTSRELMYSTYLLVFAIESVLSCAPAAAKALSKAAARLKNRAAAGAKAKAKASTARPSVRRSQQYLDRQQVEHEVPPGLLLPHSPFPLALLILCSLLDLLTSLIQFSLLRSVPGVLSVSLLTSQTIFTSLMDSPCRNNSRLHVVALAILISGMAISLLPPLLHLSSPSETKPSINISVVLYAVAPVFASVSTVLKESAVASMVNPPDAEHTSRRLR